MGQLEEGTDSLGSDMLVRVLPLLEMHAWTAGTLMIRRLPGLLWPQLPAVARGLYLAGLARHMRRAAHSTPIDVLDGNQPSSGSATTVFDVAAEILRELPGAELLMR